jgi:hypothetical protein
MLLLGLMGGCEKTYVARGHIAAKSRLFTPQRRERRNAGLEILAVIAEFSLAGLMSCLSNAGRLAIG